MENEIIFAADVRKAFGGISNTTMHRYMNAKIIPRPFKVGKLNAWYTRNINASLQALSEQATEECEAA